MAAPDDVASDVLHYPAPMVRRRSPDIAGIRIDDERRRRIREQIEGGTLKWRMLRRGSLTEFAKSSGIPRGRLGYLANRSKTISVREYEQFFAGPPPPEITERVDAKELRQFTILYLRATGASVERLYTELGSAVNLRMGSLLKAYRGHVRSVDARVVHIMREKLSECELSGSKLEIAVAQLQLVNPNADPKMERVPIEELKPILCYFSQTYGIGTKPIAGYQLTSANLSLSRRSVDRLTELYVDAKRAETRGPEAMRRLTAEIYGRDPEGRVAWRRIQALIEFMEKRGYGASALLGRGKRAYDSGALQTVSDTTYGRVLESYTTEVFGGMDQVDGRRLLLEQAVSFMPYYPDQHAAIEEKGFTTRDEIREDLGDVETEDFRVIPLQNLGSFLQMRGSALGLLLRENRATLLSYAFLRYVAGAKKMCLPKLFLTTLDRSPEFVHLKNGYHSLAS